MKVQLHEQAQVDIDDAALWYDEHEPGLGDEFLADVDRRLSSLPDQSEVWPLWPGTRSRRYPVRRRLLARFPYGIAYQVVGDTIVVLAVAAHKKRPRHWADRIQR